MKIIVVGQYPPPFHGSNVMAKMLSLALEGMGHKVVFIDKSFSKNIAAVGRFSFRKLFRVPILVFLLGRAIIVQRPHFCIYFIACAKGVLVADAFLLSIARLFHFSYILYFHGKGFRKRSSEHLFWRFIIKTTLNRALGGVVLGEILKNDVLSYIPRKRLEVIPNAIEWKPLVRVSAEQSTVNVLFLSNIISSKGAFDFLKAAKIVLETAKNTRFILAGPEQDENFCAQLKSYIAQNGLKPFVDMPGGVYGKEKEKLFASCHIFVFPTYYYYETFGLVNLEAMRAGLPVISSSEGAIPEVVQDEVTGFIVNPRDPEEIADCILRLVRDPELRKRMGQAGRERFEKEYTFKVYERRWDRSLHFFDSLLQRKHL